MKCTLRDISAPVATEGGIFTMMADSTNSRDTLNTVPVGQEYEPTGLGIRNPCGRGADIYCGNEISEVST